MPAALRLALAAAVRMVDGVHRRAAHRRALAFPAAPARLAAGLVLVVGVPDLADGGATGQQHAAHLARGQAEHAVTVVLGDELYAGAGRARHLPALARLQLDVVDERAGRDVLERKRVPRADVGVRAGLDHRPDLEPRGREDVGLLAVHVVEQRDARRAVRVVLDRGHLRRDPVLAALEVDDPVAALVAAALVARGDPAVDVPAAGLLQRRGQRLLRLRLRDLVEGRDRHEAAAGARRLELFERHQTWAPAKIWISWPSATWTIAFFQPCFVPLIWPRRFGFGWTFETFTAVTLTSKSSSTAWRICVLCASGWTRNAYLRASIRL